MNKKNKNKKSKKKLIIVLVVFVIFAIVISTFLLGSFKEEKKVAEEVKVLESLDGYDYHLEDNETEYYNNLFDELKGVLNADEIDEEKYASLISQLFIADYFNLDNKLNKNDIGGTQYVYTEFQEDFILLSMDSVYKTVESNIYGDRVQELPIVSNVEITNITTDEFEYGDETDDNAYILDVAIEYEKDLGYQEAATLTLIHSNDKLEIAKMS